MNTFQHKEKQQILSKYAEKEEFDFWNEFADNGLFSYEQEALKVHLKPGARILDIGCGCGREASVLAEQGYKFWAMDIVPQMVEATQKRMKKAGLKVETTCANICEEVPFSQIFDIVLCFEQVYQHITERDRRISALKNIRDSIKDDGSLLLTVFNEGDINLWDRFLWMQQSDWKLAKMILWKGTNLMDTRYSRSDDKSGKVDFSAGWKKRLRLFRWKIAYFVYLLHRKLKIKWVYLRKADTDTFKRKKVNRSNPLCESPGFFSLALLSFPEIQKELKEGGFDISEVIPFLNAEGKFSSRGKSGAPLLLLVATPISAICTVRS